MVPYSRPKRSDLYTLCQSELLENHTLHSGTYLYSPYMAVSPPPPPHPGPGALHRNLYIASYTSNFDNFRFVNNLCVKLKVILLFKPKGQYIAVIRYRIVKKRKYGLSATKKKLLTETLFNPVVNGLKTSFASSQLSNNPTTETIILYCSFSTVR